MGTEGPPVQITATLLPDERSLRAVRREDNFTTQNQKNLYDAARNGETEEVEGLVLQRVAHPNKETCRGGRSALCVAASKGHVRPTRDGTAWPPPAARTCRTMNFARAFKHYTQGRAPRVPAGLELRIRTRMQPKP